MGIELDLCQKKLDTYLEGKRSIFPRFYFVAPQDLLKILSNGSDPTQIQDDFEKMFDAINKVKFDEAEKNMITEIIQTQGGDESMPLNEGVMAEGNVELWLTKLEQEMQKSVKSRCLAAANDFLSLKFTGGASSGEVSEFIHRVNEYQSQFALLGIQLIWAQKVTEALEVKQKDRKAEFKKKQEEIKKMLVELTNLCMGDIKGRFMSTR
jgi:dynein heavy chain